MAEAVQQSIEGGHETRLRAETPGAPGDGHSGVQARMTVTGFEPEVLAFCCEH